MPEENETAELKLGAKRVYEIGYLLSPLIPVEVLAERVAKNFKEVIIAAGGEVINDPLPQHLTLSYPIKKQFDHQRLTFSEAFFGALRFKVEPPTAEKLTKQFKTAPDLVRYLLIEIPKAILLDEERLKTKVNQLPRPVGGAKGADPETKAPITEAEMDKEIEQLLTVES
ncbi:MAG: 30S ribosomal protein S6 [Patescibacteria group bacterium]